MINFDIGKLIGPALAVGGILIFLGWFASQQREVTLAKVERNNAKLSSKAGAAGRKSLDPNVSGVFNPYYRD
jgi:hypothetical protein